MARSTPQTDKAGFFFILPILLLGLLHSGLINGQNENDSKWGYSIFDGPQYWCNPLHEGQCCRNNRQSPINIDTADLKFMSEEMQLFNYNTSAKRIVLANNGRTVVVHMFGSNKVPNILFGSKRMRFGLDSFHFHWGSNDSRGSEHSINGSRYSLEMHLVHINEKYESLEKARVNPDGIAVLAVFFQISDNDNINFDHFVKALTKVKLEGDHVDIRHNFAIDSLLPSNLQTVYAYRGSLTTPPCSEAVTWFVVAEPNTMSERQITAFRDLRTTIKPIASSRHSEVPEIQLSDNYRPQQELQHRQVFQLKGFLNS